MPEHLPDERVTGDAVRTEARTFLDDQGTEWRVSEAPFSGYDRRTGHSLIFVSENAVRRVRDYPADWHRLSVRELIALSWNV